MNDSMPPSPSHGAWLTEPASIDEPLLLLDEEAMEAPSSAAVVARLRAELREARVASKVDRAALEALTCSVEALEREHDGLRTGHRRLEQENGVLRLQLQDHHGIMAADWAQTLGFQERLRQEEAAAERLAGEVAELREDVAAQTEQASMLRQDAARWQLLSRAAEPLKDVNSSELDEVLEVTVPGLARLQAETRARSRAAMLQLHGELEQQLCAVCRDAKKAVLFLPCMHICVCEACRGRLRPYRCPICQEPVQSHIGRVHF